MANRGDSLSAEYKEGLTRARQFLAVRSFENGGPLVEVEFNGKTLALRAPPCEHTEAMYDVLEHQIRLEIAYQMGWPVLRNLDGRAQWVRRGANGVAVPA